MTIEFWIPFWISFGFFIVAAIAVTYFSIEAYINRNQVKLLQAQCREYRKSIDDGRMALTVEGLWPDLDEKEQLRERVRELEGGNEPK